MSDTSAVTPEDTAPPVAPDVELVQNPLPADEHAPVDTTEREPDQNPDYAAYVTALHKAAETE
jgi:hypothetical protein